MIVGMREESRAELKWDCGSVKTIGKSLVLQIEQKTLNLNIRFWITLHYKPHSSTSLRAVSNRTINLEKINGI